MNDEGALVKVFFRSCARCVRVGVDDGDLVCDVTGFDPIGDPEVTAEECESYVPSTWRSPDAPA